MSCRTSTAPRPAAMTGATRATSVRLILLSRPSGELEAVGMLAREHPRDLIGDARVAR